MGVKDFSKPCAWCHHALGLHIYGEGSCKARNPACACNRFATKADHNIDDELDPYHALCDTVCCASGLRPAHPIGLYWQMTTIEGTTLVVCEDCARELSFG